MKLEQVELFHRGSMTGQVVTSGLTYDAKGQRQSVDHGNGTTTSYTYDPETFRVTRIETVRASDSAVLQDLEYAYDPIGNITEVSDAAQATIFFANNAVDATREYTYDPLYRLIEATGREH